MHMMYVCILCLVCHIVTGSLYYSQLLVGTIKQSWVNMVHRQTLAKALVANLEWIMKDKTKYAIDINDEFILIVPLNTYKCLYN